MFWIGGDVAPEAAGAGHDRFVFAGIGEGEEPDLVEVAVVEAVLQVEVRECASIVEPVGIVRVSRLPQATSRSSSVVGEAVGLGREHIGVDALDDLVVQVAAADLS